MFGDRSYDICCFEKKRGVFDLGVYDGGFWYVGYVFLNLGF